MHADRWRHKVDAVALESDDEARRAAEAIIADVASGQTEAADIFVTIYSEPSDGLRIGRHLVATLTEAFERWRDGDRSPETSRLVALMAHAESYRKAQEADEAIAKAERAAERRAATWAAIVPAPDIADKMTGVGPYGVPIPEDATPIGEFLATRVAQPEALMAFYVHDLRANGWTLDLDNSRPTSSTDLPPQCYFSSPAMPGRYVAILIAPDEHDPLRTRISISDHED